MNSFLGLHQIENQLFHLIGTVAKFIAYRKAWLYSDKGGITALTNHN